MGRPIKKKWFKAKEGSVAGDLAVTTTSGTEVIINQKGTGVYTVASGRVKLVDGAPAGAGEAQLTHDGRNVRKITQYRVYYFDDGNPSSEDSAVWRDGDANIIGTFVPALITEGGAPPPPPPAGEQATAIITSVGAGNAITGVAVTNGGSGYTVAPAVTVSGGNGDAVLTASLAGGIDGAVTSINIDNPGTGYTTIDTITIAAP